MKRIKFTFALKIVAASLIVVSAAYLWLGFTKDMWNSTWYLYIISVFIWWFLDLIFNYTRGPMFYRGLLPFIAVIYSAVSYVTGNWIDSLIIISFMPLLVLVYNSKFYALKYSVVPISASILVIIYLFLGFSFSMWHPYWIIFLLVPVIALLQNYE